MGQIQRTPEFEKRVREQAAQFGPYIALRTLMGGDPDCNRRTIYNILTENRVSVFNDGMEVWTAEMQSALDAALKKLNDGYLEEQKKAT